MKLSEHLASPSEASLSQISELNGLRLSPHFTLGEFTKTSYHPLDGNIPSSVLPAIVAKFSLTASKILTLEKSQMIFGFLLA